MCWTVITQVLVLGVLVTYSRPLKENLARHRAAQAFAEEYLLKYGYISESSSKQNSALQTIDNAVSKFQAFAGLKQTGQLDNETLELMSKRRCGVKDFVSESLDVNNQTAWVLPKRQKRFALQGSRWKRKRLTYRVTKYPTKTGLSRKDVDLTMKKAFDIWSKETNLEFDKKLEGDVHIEISFERKDHGDDDPFDGLGGTLAHAFFPVYGGDVHFDDEENWTVNTFRGTSLLMSASHELGHSLGLSHSDVKDSMMAPFYRGFEPNVKLHADDIKGIQELYGNKVTRTKKTTEKAKTVRPKVSPVTFFPIKTPPSSTPLDITPPATTPPILNSPHTASPSSTFPTSTETSSTSTDVLNQIDNKALCNRKTIDTMVTVKNGDTYAFQRNIYWKLTDTSVEPGYPRQISEGWKGLFPDLDAAFTWTNGKTYFIKGSQYWRFSEVGILDDSYPRNFSKAFEGVPDNIDAAMLWPVNNKIYFFKGSKYWKFDPKKTPSVDMSYPRPIGNWKGIPDNLDAAIQYSNGKTYFFKNGKYYRFDNKKGAVDDSAEPKYPRETGLWWFGCKEESAPLVIQDS